VKLPKALQRFNAQFRPDYGRDGDVIGYSIPPEDSPRYRPPQSGRESGWLYQHNSDNRAGRRERSRDYSLTGTLPGENEPYVKEKESSDKDA
jgi:hypothetical protein